MSLAINPIIGEGWRPAPTASSSRDVIQPMVAVVESIVITHPG